MQEDERRAIGRDLHDSVGQALTAIRIHAQLAVELSDDQAKRAKVLNRVCSTTDAALEELRRALARLGPAVLDEVGLRQALDRQLDAFADHSKVTISRNIPDITGLSPAIELAIYRIAQEALTNIAKHASASNVTITLELVPASTLAPATARLVIADDGVGMSSSQFAKTTRDSEARREQNKGRSQGLRGMRERAELLGGQLDVVSSPDEGSSLTVSIPVMPGDETDSS